jgi:hypothetical protein
MNSCILVFYETTRIPVLFCGEIQADVAVNGDVMTFIGITIGYIDFLGPQTNMIDMMDRENGILAIQNFWETVAGGSRTDHEAFVRALICDKITRHHLGLERSPNFSW